MKGDFTNGRRMRQFSGHHQLMSGEYGQWDGTWWAVTPNGLTANLSSHDVTEHADGTITVSESIKTEGGNLTRNGNGYAHWHGWLKHGVWEEL